MTGARKKTAHSFYQKLMKLDKVSKRLAEIKSLWGNGEPVYSKYRPIEKLCIFISSWKYRLTEGLYYKIKYFVQRHTRGFDDLDKWNAAWYISRKAIPVLTAMRNSFHGTSIRWHREDRFGNIIELTKDEVFIGDNIPESLNEEEWKAILDDIIYAFQFPLDTDGETFEDGEGLFANFSEEKYNAALKRHKRGLKLFSIYFMNLWD